MYVSNTKPVYIFVGVLYGEVNVYVMFLKVPGCYKYIWFLSSRA